MRLTEKDCSAYRLLGFPEIAPVMEFRDSHAAFVVSDQLQMKLAFVTGEYE
jgi:hypothetical protein